MTSRERMLAFLQGLPVDHLCSLPITMMFAADQIGAQYGDYTLDSRVLAEAQIAASERFAFDHVSTITETREAPDCGAVIQPFDDQPYAIDESRSRLIEKGELSALHAPDPCQGTYMRERLRGLELLRDKVGEEKIVEGWVEGPCGGGADLRGINRLMLDFFDDPVFVRELFAFVVELAVRFGEAQIKAGADLIGIGDPAASLVGPDIYEEFVWPFQKRLVDSLHEAGALLRLHICGDTRPLLKGMGQLGCEIVDIDSMVPLSVARSEMGPKQILAGGVDPVRILKQGTPETVAKAVGDCHLQAGPGYIVAAGCEVPRGTPAENLRAMTTYAQSHRP